MCRVEYTICGRRECYIGSREDVHRFVEWLKSSMPLYYKGDVIGDLHSDITDVVIYDNDIEAIIERL